MVHYPLHHEKVSKLIDSFGIAGYGAYWIINELILSSPGKSLSKNEVLIATNNKINPMLVEQILGEKEHFFQSQGRFYSELDRKKDVTPEMAYMILDKSGLRGRGFSKIIQIYGAAESFVMSEFDKWKKAKEGTLFSDEQHVFNSFNHWMKNCEIPKQKKKDDWDGV